MLFRSQADEAVSPAIDRTDCLRRIAVAVECIAGSLADSRTIGETVRIAMHGAKGTAFSTQVQEIRESGITTTYDVGAEGTETGIHITVVTVEAYYTSTATSPTIIT